MLIISFTKSSWTKECSCNTTNDNWFGVTYKEDKQMAIDAINKHIASGVYPNKLWS